jgi:hypothetical protein
MLRRRVAERLVRAQQGAALLTTFNEIDMSAARELRRNNQEEFQRKHGVKLGYMSLFVKAVADALLRVRGVNGEIRDDHIILRNYCDIGVAIPPTPETCKRVLALARQIFAQQLHLASGRPLDPRCDSYEGRLPGPGWPHNCDALTRYSAKAYTLQDFDRARCSRQRQIDVGELKCGVQILPSCHATGSAACALGREQA